MYIDIAMFTAGLLLLYFGAEYLVKGSANTSVILGINPIIVGLTVVAFGTSMPELVVCLLAVMGDSADLAIGNVIGSNIANIGLVMAMGAIVFPLVMQRRTLTRDLPYMVAISLLFLVLALDETLSRMDGAILFAGVALFTGYCIYGAVKGKDTNKAVEAEVNELMDDNHSLKWELGITVVGMIGVIIGAKFLVDSATSIARSFGVSELVIGITIVAIGTSLPELATTAIAAMRRQTDIAVGNIIGSNIYNIGWVLGVTLLVKPLHIAWDTIIHEGAVMAFFALAIIPSAMMLKMGRVGGVFLLLAYFGFIGWTAVYRMGAG